MAEDNPTDHHHCLCLHLHPRWRCDLHDLQCKATIQPSWQAFKGGRRQPGEARAKFEQSGIQSGSLCAKAGVIYHKSIKTVSLLRQ